MKRSLGVLAALAVLAAPTLAAPAPSEEHDLSFQRTRAKTVTATVEAVDQTTRMVTLKKKDGNSISFRAGDRVKNLAQVKVGDEITASYYESVAVYVSKPDGGKPMNEASASVTGAKKGHKPGGVAEEEVTVTATVESIASDKASVTLKNNDGTTTVYPIKNPENLEGVAVGDQVTIVASRALAVSMKPAKKPAKSGASKSTPKK